MKIQTKEECNNFLLSLHLINKNISDKDKIRLLYTITNPIEKNYKVYKIKKHNGNYRTIYSPNPLLKSIQRKILKNILNNKKVSKYAKAYKKGISIKENALPHLNQPLILKLDITDFFENIEYYDIYRSCFGIEYFPPSVGHLLTTLCTYESRLPQGAPTSAYISNIILRDFDEEIGNWCEKNNINYTRYSDDMTFSGDFNPHEIISLVRKKLYYLNLKLNNKKIKVINNSQQQRITGIVVNKKIQVSSSYRQELRQEIYYIKKYGLKSHLNYKKITTSPINYLNILYGKINYILSVDNHNQEFIKYKEYLSNLKKTFK